MTTLLFLVLASIALGSAIGVVLAQHARRQALQDEDDAFEAYLRDLGRGEG